MSTRRGWPFDVPEIRDARPSEQEIVMALLTLSSCASPDMVLKSADFQYETDNAARVVAWAFAVAARSVK